MLAGGLGLLGYSMWEAQAYQTRHVTVPTLPPGHQPLTILHLSDIHLMPHDTKRASWLRSLVELEPDLVINTGDNISHAGAIPVLLDALEPLLAIPGVFVFGSNDYYAPVFKNPLTYLRMGPTPIRHAEELPWRDLEAGFADAGWLNLNNHRDTIKVGSTLIDMRGVDDPHIHRDRYDDLSTEASSADLSLGVVHAPYRRVLDAMTTDGADVIFAGHTHGGQICLPGYGTLVTNCDLQRHYAKGLSRYRNDSEALAEWDLTDPLASVPSVAETWLHVSPGIGTSPYAPIRLACRPEAIVVTLTAR